MKFGGTSVRDAAMIRIACDLVAEAAKTSQIVMVSSTMKGVTDQLISCAKTAELGEEAWRELVEAMQSRHTESAGELLDSDSATEYANELDSLLGGLKNVLQGVQLVRECSPRSMDLVMSFGEQMSCMLITRVLASLSVHAVYHDPRTMILTDMSFGAARVNLEQSYITIRSRLAALAPDGIAVVPGFVAATPNGATTTLGRNGSDYTASIIGAAVDATSVEIWTDVDGVLSADPRTVPEAFVIPELSYEEAMELSFFGAEVLHPATMVPAVEKNVPIFIRNTMNPAAEGTRIAGDVASHNRSITGIASIEDVTLINVEGGGLLGMPGVASHVFQALSDAKINIIMISQASSEHSICLVCRTTEVDGAVASLEKRLDIEIQNGTIHRIGVIPDLEIIAVIGENMRGKPGMSGKLFSSLGDAKINVLAIAQGSSERNISFVIQRSERELALRTVHRAFLE